MALGFEETLQMKLDEIVSSVKQEQERLKAEWQELKVKAAQLEEERAAFEAEKQMLVAANEVVKSKVKLDVGGTTYHASRTTLTSIHGSTLEAMFSGRHRLEEDEDGRVFIDRDGATFKLVLEYLRSPTFFSLDGLSKREVASCRAEFYHFGLPLPVPDAPALCLRMNTNPKGKVSAQLQGDTCNINCTSVWEGCGWAIGAEVLADDAAWKLRVRQCSDYLMMGVIANPTPSSGHLDATFAGWCANAGELFAHGSDKDSPGWPGWQENDEAIFKLSVPARRLTLHLKRTGQCYTFSNLTAGKAGQWRFCVCMFNPTSVILSSLTDDEHALVRSTKRQKTSCRPS